MGKEKKREESKANDIYQFAFRATGVAMAITDAQNNIELSNPAFEKLSGYAKAELAGKSLEEFFGTEDIPRVQEFTSHESNEFQFIDKWGAIKQVVMAAEELPDERRTISLFDISRRSALEKKSRAQRAHLQALIENMPLAVVALDASGKVRHCNPAFERLFHYAKSEVLDQPLTELIAKTDENEDGQSLTKRILGNGKSHFITVCRRKNGSLVDIEALGVPVTLHGSEINAYAMCQDISERKWVERHLTESLREKELLLEEIHHRVKNNLQIISSMLRLQSGYIENAQALAMFKVSQHRVRSMALVHEKIYQSKDLAKIDFGEYLRDLTNYLLHSYKNGDTNVCVKTETIEKRLGIDTAIPCGLIANELVSNALRHAFPSGTEGQIAVALKSKNDRTILKISDNGVGFPEEVDFRSARSLGLQLVTTLTEQLSGEITLNNGKGTEFIITFRDE